MNELLNEIFEKRCNKRNYRVFQLAEETINVGLENNDNCAGAPADLRISRPGIALRGSPIGRKLPYSKPPNKSALQIYSPPYG